MIRDAKKRGVQVTGETAPHYLLLTEEALRKKNADWRMSPPLRTDEDRRALLEALRDGTLDAIATDHAPHSEEDKADFTGAQRLHRHGNSLVRLLYGAGKARLFNLAGIDCKKCL